MANKIESRKVDGGAEIVRLVSTDRDISVPGSIDGAPVVSLASRFLMGSPNTDSRSLTIPDSVVRMAPDALSGIIGLREVRYLGDFRTFNSFGTEAEYDCRVVSAFGGEPFSFDFLGGYPMSFPGFDEGVLSMSYRMSADVAMRRLAEPVLLSEEHRRRYADYMRKRYMPMAEHAVSCGDIPSLSGIMETGLLTEDDLRSLLSGSLRSGKTAMTSAIMSMIRRSQRGKPL